MVHVDDVSRRYTRFSLPLCLTAICISTTGCHSAVHDVYVDTGAAVFQGSSGTVVARDVGVAAQPNSSVKFTLPASPAVTEERVGGAGAVKVQASVAASREQTFNRIVRRLQTAYKREAASLRNQKLLAFSPVRAALIAKALALVSDEYRRYADLVGPKIARLAVTAGFPDPDPKGKRKPSGLEGLDKLEYETSQQLRSEISTLNADFKRYSETTLRAADADADAKLTELLDQVARQVGDVDARAEAKARSEVSQAQAQLGSLLADRPATALPATPEGSVVVATGSQSAVQPPRVDSMGPLAGDDVVRVKQDLDVWLAVNHYTARPRGKARDATSEFIEWRKRFRQEPSATH